MREDLKQIPLTNAKFNAYAAMFEAEKAIAEHVGDLNGTLGEIVCRLEKLGDGFPSRDEWSAYFDRDAQFRAEFKELSTTMRDLCREVVQLRREQRDQSKNAAANVAAGRSKATQNQEKPTEPPDAAA